MLSTDIYSSPLNYSLLLSNSRKPFSSLISYDGAHSQSSCGVRFIRISNMFAITLHFNQAALTCLLLISIFLPEGFLQIHPDSQHLILDLIARASHITFQRFTTSSSRQTIRLNTTPSYSSAAISHARTHVELPTHLGVYSVLEICIKVRCILSVLWPGLLRISFVVGRGRFSYPYPILIHADYCVFRLFSNIGWRWTRILISMIVFWWVSVVPWLEPQGSIHYSHIPLREVQPTFRRGGRFVYMKYAFRMQQLHFVCATGGVF